MAFRTFVTNIVYYRRALGNLSFVLRSMYPSISTYGADTELMCASAFPACEYIRE